MKIADVTVGTEYAATPYQTRNETEWSLLERSRRVLVRSILPGGKVRVSDLNREEGRFRDSDYEMRAASLVMPWKDAVPIRKEIRDRRIAAAKARQEQLAREQVAFRALGEFLEQQDALDMPGLPYHVKSSVALANGDEGLRDMGHDLGQRPTNRHEPKIEVNVITLLALLRKAYTEGYENAAWDKDRAAWSREVN
jgi:hypothetical protein